MDVCSELIRRDAIDRAPSITMTFDVHLIDTTTRPPSPTEHTEFWQADATGVYSGTNNTDNGKDLDPSILSTTFARAVYPSNDSGIVQGGGAQDFAGGSTDFLDRALIDLGYRMRPYTSNPNTILPNSQDGTLATCAEMLSPIACYIHLGEDLADVVMAWLKFEVDTAAENHIVHAATWTEDGGVDDPDESLKAAFWGWW
ncbi:hypothetical protein N0V93_010330 [Gnomoniopsis smithogilvyi]|uniref:Uncharacterized protein n=1 Tax=Gnomoniopsis smithogilvyi TaxID=1191159 RepID=A0A9W8YKP6_9PEZI|nr:hypothetical protein N0V93_010330 [Gnomoniopsis smithogilvyi]